ncbi:MAG: hypothetical protein CME71_09355 [Halobacteriovorax sp.]|nr:hypothetical protein [Halobacteriovorax sp.]|tara:strand:- start:517 stop:822 length:306 start_codon:yes stop_codon:yes gene_type:complete
MNDEKDLFIKNALAKDHSQPKTPRGEWHAIEEKISGTKSLFNFKVFAFACSLVLVLVVLGRNESRPTFSEQDKVDIYSYVLEDSYFDNSEEVTTWASVDSF